MKFIIKPSILKPFGGIYNSAQVFGKVILVPKHLHDSYIKEDIFATSIIEHELVHIERMYERGVLVWYLLYLTSAKFRLNEELEAIRIEAKYLKEHGYTFDYETKARYLSSWLYLKMITYQNAVTILKDI